MSPNTSVTVEHHGAVGWIINPGPGPDGVSHLETVAEIDRAWAELGADPTVRVIVHTGGAEGFFPGRVPVATDPDLRPPRPTAGPVSLKPVIVAVNGLCAGDGLRWIAAADIVIAAADATFCDPHVSSGQFPSPAVALMRRVPAESVMRMALLGEFERIGSARALEMGLISEIVDPADHLRERAHELAERVARNSPAAMAATKQALRGALEMGLTDACRAGAAHLVSLWGHPDQAEGPRAFAERREPLWVDPIDESGADR